jgi:hypothetical protein
MKYRLLLVPMVLAVSVVAAQKNWKWQLTKAESFTLKAKELKNLGQLQEPQGRSSAALFQIEVNATYPVNVAFVAPLDIAALQADFKSIDSLIAPCKFVSVLNLKANCSVRYEAFPVTLVVQDSNEAWLTLHEGGKNAVNDVKVKLSDYEFR